MADKHIADGESAFKAASTGPDACRVGNTVVPFDSFQQLSSKKSYDKQTKARGQSILTVGSVINGSKGNAGAGVVSGTSLGSGDVIVLTGSPTVKSNKQPIARHLSDVAMNNGNTAGKLYTQQSAPNAAIENNRTPCNNPPKRSQALDELEKMRDQLKNSSWNANKLDQYVRFDETNQMLDSGIKSMRPGQDSWGITKAAAGAGRATAGFLKDVVLGAGELTYKAFKQITPVNSTLSQVENAITAENLRLGNTCLEGIKQQAQQKASAMVDAAKKKAGDIRDQWNKGDIGDKTELVTRGAEEIAALVAPVTKAGTVGKAGEAVNAAGKVGEATKGAQTVATADKMGEAARVANAERAAQATKAEQAAQGTKAGKAAEEAHGGKQPKQESGGGGKKGDDGTKVKGRKKRVKCFCVQDHAKGGREEYERQLKHQQNGINSMSADDYLRERGAFTGKDPCTGQALPGGKTKTRDRNVTKDAKTKRLDELTRQYTKELRTKGVSAEKAKSLGKAKAEQEVRGGGYVLNKNGEKRYVGGQDALHNQDMVAGGQDVIGNGSTLTEGDFGWGDTNRHIGSQWNGERINSIDKEACEMRKSGKGHEKMDVELRPCGKHEGKSAGCKQKKAKK